MRPPRLKGRANDPLASPVGANPALPAERLRPPEPQRASVKPTSWTRPTRAVPWNLPLGARRPGHCPEPDPRLCLHKKREAPPKARWFYPPLPRANKPRSAAGNSATLRLERRTPG
jgi:hypothetical protein